MKVGTWMAVWVAMSGWVWAATPAATNSAPEPVRFAFSLADGSRVMGVPTIESVPLQTVYARLDIPLRHVLSVTMTDDHGSAALALRNGDRLRGVMNQATIDLMALFGRVSIGIGLVRTFSVLPQGTANTMETGPCAVTIETSMGTISVELWPDKAPATVANFLTYVDEEFYDGLVFHRVIDKFMIQGGGLGPDMQQKSPTHPAVKNEARSDVPNKRGTLAMARTVAVDSAGSQFFINQADNKFLDHRGERDAEFGYCVFGKVLEGLDVVDAIAKVPTESVAGIKDVPVEAVTIKSIRRVTP